MCAGSTSSSAYLSGSNRKANSLGHGPGCAFFWVVLLQLCPRDEMDGCSGGQLWVLKSPMAVMTLILKTQKAFFDESEIWEMSPCQP